MRIPESTIQEISDKASIVDVVSEYTSLVLKGDKHWGCCPFHNEKTPSFTVTEDKNMFYCFGCQKGGSIFNFIMEIEHMSFVDAVVHLGQKSGVRVELSNNNQSDEQVNLRDSQLSIYDKVCGSFSYILEKKEEGKKALDYLYSRGLNDEIIQKFRLGYAPVGSGWLYNFLRNKNYSDEFLKSTGFFSKKNSRVSIFFDRVMFPVINHHNQVVAFSGRSLSDYGPKYINSPETMVYHKGSILFGINHAIKSIRNKKEFILCEGNLDVIALHQVGLSNAVAPLGTAFTESQAKLLKRYADKGTILFDGDSAGIKATEKACIILERVGITPSVISLAEGLDPAEILKKNGPEALIKSCKYTINSFDYLLKRVLTQFGGESPESKESVAKGMLPYINSIISDIRKEACLEKLATELGVSVSSVLNASKANSQRTFIKKREDNGEIYDIYNDKELYLMCALVVNSEYFKNVNQYVDEFGVTSRPALTVYNAISNSLKEGITSIESIIRRVDNDKLRQLIISKCTSSEFDDNPGNIIIDSLVFLKRKALLIKISELERHLNDVSRSGDIKEISLLLKQKSELDDKLGRIEDY
ncbi:DNA primase [Thiospirochaeta perfilievii]|uniref:DNA primase n=1 Tax=Thiospirochaeta perfilievii TaxID=252967 RepID=A0A5C1QI18_9SPIO|nr:DNA primase [Thiospirochaeta perfilievii]QEN05892.1 DNA primase [Thiospirochaeta perfilievii]